MGVGTLASVWNWRHKLENASRCWLLTRDLASWLLVDLRVRLLLGLLHVLLEGSKQFDLLALLLGRNGLGLGLQQIERLARLL